MIDYSTTNLGKLGETIAEKYLLSKKYRIIDKNYSLVSNRTHKKIGEIDLIAKKGSVYIFIEVKARGKRKEGIPLESKINFKKKKRLIIMSESWLTKHKLSLTTARQLDIIIIVIDLINKKAFVKHYENAINETNN